MGGASATKTFILSLFFGASQHPLSLRDISPFRGNCSNLAIAKVEITPTN
jgi:hypothetical protein